MYKFFPNSLIREYSRGANVRWLKITYGLTDREIEVIALIARGLTYKEIAEFIHISPETIRKDQEKIKEKINVDRLPQVGVFAAKNNLI